MANQRYQKKQTTIVGIDYSLNSPAICIADDNFDFNIKKSPRTWSYTFNENTINLNDIDKIGIASNSLQGKTFVKVISVDEI